MPEQMVRQTLRKPELIRKTKDFNRLFAKSQVARATNFRVHYHHREEPGEPFPVRAAFVAGKRIGNSVTRNRIKRLLREAFRRIKKDLKPREPVDLVFVASRDFSGVRSTDVISEMRELLDRIGLLDPAAEKPGKS